MIFQFDLTRLEHFQRESLLGILDVIQSENENEIIVFVVKFPYEYKVLADNNVELLKGLEYTDPRAITGVRDPRRSLALETQGKNERI